MKLHYRTVILLALALVLVLVACVAPALATVQKGPVWGVPTAAGTPLASVVPVNPAKFTCLPLSGPFMGSHSTYDFQSDAVGSAPTMFPDGTFSSITTILAVMDPTAGNNEWSAPWTPYVVGKHVALCENGVTITFDRPQAAVGAVVAPDNWGGLSP